MQQGVHDSGIPNVAGALDVAQQSIALVAIERFHRLLRDPLTTRYAYVFDGGELIRVSAPGAEAVVCRGDRGGRFFGRLQLLNVLLHVGAREGVQAAARGLQETFKAHELILIGPSRADRLRRQEGFDVGG